VEERERPGQKVVDRSEGFGERLLGRLLDRAHDMPPQLIAPMIAKEVAVVGGRDVSILLQDYGRELLVPLPGLRLLVGAPREIADSPAGTAFLRATPVEVWQAEGVRVYLPLLDGSDEVGVMMVTLDSVNEDDRRLLARLAGLVADMVITKGNYTDLFFKVRRRGLPMTVAAEIQWALLPPLSMNTPQVSLAGVLEPAYEIAGDSLDYALNDNVLHLAIIDAMGHELNAAVLATVAIGAYRHARRADIGLAELYSFMDKAIDAQFGPDQFVTAQMLRLDVETGELQWVNAGHPAPLLIRGNRVIQRLESPTTLPIGFGGAVPVVSSTQLTKDDRVMFYTDGLTEEHRVGGEEFGETRMINVIERTGPVTAGVSQMARELSASLLRERGGHTSDDATLFLIEWHGGSADHLAVPDL
jgi:serine phosphatase RsbU (regulator of sigma subunit)